MRLLPATVIGSYPVPEWLGRMRNDWYAGRISKRHLDEAHEMAIKAAVLDQQLVGVDIISDGELRRDNDVDYVLARINGIDIRQRTKIDYFDYFDAAVSRPLPASDSLGLVDDYHFVRQLTELPVKVSITGPFSLARRIDDTAYSEHGDLVRALARVLAEEAARLAVAGATILQIDEPFLAGRPEEIELAVEAINIVTSGADVSWTLHVCYGNRYARPLWEGHYDFLFPLVKHTNVDVLALEFARTGDDDLRLLEQNGWDRGLGLGVIDVKSDQVESADLVAARIRRAMRVVSPNRLVINPDCGLRHVPPAIARAKLAAMVAGAAQVRAEIAAAPAPPDHAAPARPDLAAPARPDHAAPAPPDHAAPAPPERASPARPERAWPARPDLAAP
jgi:5-methyltetrahydropteroyltriglutamate--homocysteine methyltransferase